MGDISLTIQPDAEDIEAAEVLVDGTIGGRPYRFLLDTGAARSCVRFDDYTSTFATAGTHSSSGVFTSGSDDVITVPSVALGPITRTDFPLVRMADGAHSGRRNLIGMDLLKDFSCYFLFAESRVVIDPEDVPKAANPLRALFLGERYHPYVDVQCGDQTARAVWDTGAGLTVADLSFIERHPRIFREVGHSKGTDAKGTEMQTPMFLMASTTIGGHPFPPITVAGVDLSGVNATVVTPMDMILGYNTLGKANWWMDFRHQQWAITNLLG